MQFGEGGSDSKIFVDEISSAYARYAKSLGFNTDLLSSNDGHVILKVVGLGAGKAFQNEPGKHCCQRVPDTENHGRRHTSMISVAILPIQENVYKPLDAEEIEITTCKGSGPGGQHRNTTDSAVRVKHIPTGITVFIDG